MILRHALRAALLVGASIATSAFTPANATGYPDHTVKLIVSLPPGSAADNTARFLSKHLSDRFKQTFVVENKPGANSFIAAQAVIASPPDGYTLFVSTNSPVTTNAAVFKNLPYDPIKDFTPIASVARFPMVLVVGEDSPFKTMADLVAAARKSPGKLNFGTSTATYQANLELFNEMNGIRATHVPYKGTSAALTDLAGGVLQYSLADVSAVMPLIRGGKLRPLGVGSPGRLKDLPDVPTMQESGNKGYEAFAWSAVFGPAKMDPAIVKTLSDAIADLLKQPQSVEFLATLGAEPFPGTPESLGKFQASELETMRGVVQRANMQQE